MWCLVVFQHDLHDQCTPQGKEKPHLEDPLSQEVVYVRVHSHGIAPNEYYGANELQLPLLLLSLLWKISISSGSIYEHENVYGGRKKVRQMDDEARLSCQNKASN